MATLAPPRLEIGTVGAPTSLDADASFNDLYRTVTGFQSEAQGAEQKFNNISDRVIGLRDQAQAAQSGTLATAAAALKAADPAKVVTKAMTAISKFAENSAVIMKGLEAVKQIHPFIGLVVVACEAAIQLELTRRGNDRKVVALKAEMLEMMEVLLDLRNIKDVHKIDPDGSTLEGRMQRIVVAAEQDIRDCSATCEKYIHKKFIVKLFDGSRWEERLAAFSGNFAERKKEFEFALSIHTAQGVDNVQRTLVTVEAHAKDGSESAQMIILFRQLESPKERELQKWIAEKGGPKAVSENEKLFKELQSKMKDTKVGGKTKSKAETTETLMIQVRDEMREDIDHLLAKDRQHFDRKFDAVVDGLFEMKNVVHRSTDRVITAIHAGPHDRIVDMDLHKIWKEMAWRGSVKARHFIVALQDHFIQKYSKEDQKNDAALLQVVEAASYPASPLLSAVSDGPQTSVLINKAIELRQEQQELQDRWAIEYITLTRVRSVLEAFDDDASGWISVREANVFTSSRPPTYSVIKWLAFWSAGFKISSSQYAKKIQNLRASYRRLQSDILNCNRARVDRYLSSMGLDTLDYLTRDLADLEEESEEDEALMAHFDDYINSEEERLITGLDRLGWDIDAFNTLQLVTGTGRIERHILPVFYLILKRHMKIIALSRYHPLDDNELWEAEQTIDVLALAVKIRVETLASNFRNQNLDPVIEFQHAYNGMFTAVWGQINGTDGVNDFEYAEEDFDEDLEADLTILKYRPFYFDVPAHIHADHIPDNEPCSGSFDGTWTGTEVYSDNKRRQDGMVVTKFRLAPEIGADSIVGSGKDCLGVFEISGTLVTDGSTSRKISFKKTYTGFTYIDPTVYAYEGTLNSEDDSSVISIVGNWGHWSEDPASFISLGNFELTQTPLIAVRHRPSAQEFEENAARARWKLALNVVAEHVRRKRWTWDYFSQRSEARRSYIDAILHTDSIAEADRFYRNWDDEDEEDYQQIIEDLQDTFTPEDLQLYNYIAQFRLQTECSHLYVTCQVCYAQMTGGRYRCITCVNPQNEYDGVDLCEDCKDQHATVPEYGMEHHPSHDMLKTLRCLETREVFITVKSARETLKTAINTMKVANAFLANRQQSSGKDEEEITIPSCVYCMKRVHKPCWYCTECESDTFLCDSCESDQLLAATDYRYNQKVNPVESTEAPEAVQEGAPAGKDTPEESKDEGGEGGEVGEGGKDGEDDEETEANEFGSEAGDGDEEYVESEVDARSKRSDEWTDVAEEEQDEESPTEPEHWWGHVLVRVQAEAPPPPARVEIDMRLTTLEEKFAAHETAMCQRLDKLEATVSSLGDKVESTALSDRLANLESLLARVLAKLG